LATKGYTVYAGCYSEKSKASLHTQCEEAKIPAGKVNYVALDVTNETSISKAVESVTTALKSSGLGLVGIINCAGMGYTGPVEYMPMKHYRACMDVNYFGYVCILSASPSALFFSHLPSYTQNGTPDVN
jgi:NAD(P)-dependent dehydrogenase (short-subunit alcohol dehydrogenase family)